MCKIFLTLLRKHKHTCKHLLENVTLVEDREIFLLRDSNSLHPVHEFIQSRVLEVNDIFSFNVYVVTILYSIIVGVVRIFRIVRRDEDAIVLVVLESPLTIVHN